MRFYVTTPIYYVNDKPHIGHAYTTIAADVLARYHASSGASCFFLTGVDEHGQKVEKAARALGIEPKAHCDAMAPRFSSLWEKLRVQPSAFIRTTDGPHIKRVQDALARLHAKGLIEQRDFEGWYCVPCERYWTEKDLVEGNCPDCRRKVELLKEKNYFFLMSRYADSIRAKIESGELEILPKSRRNEVIGFLNQGISDLCISRPKSRLSWGIPLPFDEEYVTYVWFDALLNYVSGPEYLSDNGPWWPASVHLIGKDILTTHSIYWPAMLMALELSLPKRIVAHGWWTFSGEKMSKSVGNVVDPLDLLAMYGDNRETVDAFRYFLLAEAPFGSDGVFSFDAFERRWKSDLSNDIGNLVSRAATLVEKVCGGTIEASLPESDRWVVDEYRASMNACQFSRATEAIVKYAREINQYLQDRAPWSKPENAVETLARAVSAIRLMGTLLHPFIPDSADLIAARLGQKKTAGIAEAILPFTAVISSGEPLFRRPERLKGSVPLSGELKPVLISRKEEPVTDHATIDDVKKLGLKVAVVLTAEKVEKTKKLVKLTVDLGSEQRTLIAGIAETYEPEKLIGQRVVVVSNLAPATIRGIESRGMILCASDGTTLSLVSPLLAETAAGTEIR